MLSTTGLTQPELKSAIVRDPLIVQPETTVMEAIAQMSGLRTRCETTETAEGYLGQLHLEARSSCVLVVVEGRLLGILTERDVVRLSAEQRSLEHLAIQEVMTCAVVTLHEANFTDLFFAINLLQQYHIRHLPILDEQDHLVGLVTHESLRQISRPIDLLRLRLVAEVLTSQVICATPDQSMLAIAQLMSAHRVSSVMIVQPSSVQPSDRLSAAYQIPVGIVTERDIVQFQALGLKLESCLAQTVMSTPIFAVRPDDSLWTVQQIMEQRLIRRLAVIGSQGELLGIVTQTSLLQALNPLELYKLAEGLEAKVTQLEADKMQLLENRTVDLEQQVAARTIALKAKAEQEHLVTEIATQIRSSLSLQTILDTTVAQVRQVLGCDRVNIWRVESDWQIIVVAESTDLQMCLLDTRIGDKCFKQGWTKAYRQGKIRVVPDIYTTAMSDCHRDMLIGFQIRAKILVPLLRGDRLWGFLNVSESQAPREWQPEEVELLYTLSVQLAIALQQATTYQKLQEQLIERQQAEARLRESEQRYVTLTAAAPVGIFRTDAAGNYIYVNDRWCQIAGLTVAQAIGFGWVNVIYPGDRELVSTAWYAAAQANRSFTLEYRFQRPDGSVTWVYGQSVAEEDAEGHLIGYVGTITDISDRKQAEAALIQSEAQSRAILAAIPDFMFRVGADGIYREFVTANGEIDLLPKDLNSAGLAMADVLPPEIAARQSHYIKQALRTGELQVYEQRVQINERLQDEEVRVVKNGKDEVLFMIRDISDRKRSQEALQRSEAHQRALIRAIPDLIMRIDRAGIYLEFVATPNFYIVGDLTEIVGTHVSESLPPDASRKRMECIQLALQTNSIQIYEQDLSIEGRTQIEEVRIVPYSEDEVLALVRDISDRKQAEQQLYQLNQDLETKVGERTAELQEREKFLKTLLDSFPLSVFWKDRDSVYLGCNHHFIQDAGLTSDVEIIGKTDYDMPWAKTEAAAYRLKDQQVMDSNTAHLGIIETQVQADGQQIWLETHKIPLHNLGGEVVGILGTYQDISDRKQAEETIRQQAEQEKLLREITQRIRQSLDLQTIFDTACQEIRQVIQADRVGIFKFYPESNFDDGEFVAESVVEGFPSVVAIRIHDHCFGENYASLYAKGRSYVVEDIYQHGISACHTDILAQFQVRANLVMPLLCGEELWGLLCIHQCGTTRRWQQSEVDFNQQLANQLAIAIQQSNLFEQLQTELAERHRAEVRLTETNAQLGISNQELARATRLKDEFLANMSHELRTPLNAILGMTEGLQEAAFGIINEPQRKALQTIERSGSHLLELINDILDVAKIEAGQIILECSPISVAHLCQSSLTFIKQQVFQKRIQLELKLPMQLPDLLVDERRIRQVLINLLNNAVKFTPEGGQICLEVSPAPERSSPSPRLRIAVTDTGIGIAPENLKKLFQPFIQIDSALNRQYEGTGLGLALVKRLVELHGGSVGLTSEIGVGSCFTIELPCTPVSTRQPEPIPPATLGLTPSPAGETTAQPPLILLAEDNEANINTVSSYLRAKGYRILLAKNGQEAIDLAKAHQPHLILMDIQMPEIDGLEATRQIRLDPNLIEIPIIALTALAMTGDREKCLEAGATDYLTKPVRLKQLATTIQQFLDARHHRRDIPKE